MLTLLFRTEENHNETPPLLDILVFKALFVCVGPTLGVLMSSTIKICSSRDADCGKVQVSEEDWGTAGERSIRTPCGSKPTWAEPLVDCDVEEDRQPELTTCMTVQLYE